MPWRSHFHLVTKKLNTLNFFHLLSAYSLRALNCTFTCRNSKLYWVDSGLGGCAGRPSTGGLEEVSLALAWRTGSSSVRRMEVLICKEGRLLSLQLLSVLSLRPHWKVCLCYYVLVNCLCICLCYCVFVYCHNCLHKEREIKNLLYVRMANF